MGTPPPSGQPEKSVEAPPKENEELVTLKKQIDTLQRQVQIYKAREKNPKVNRTKPSEKLMPEKEKSQDETSSQKLDSPHHPGMPHYVGVWEKYCPECGDPNPDFKDEMECSSCHMHLGAEATVEKLKACPNCGGRAAKRLGK